MFCQYCGHELANNARFCSACGEPIQNHSPSAQMPEASASSACNFDDILEPISDSKPKETIRPAKSAPQNVVREPNASQDDILQALAENGSANFWTYFYDGVLYSVDVDVTNETSDGIVIHKNGKMEKILHGMAIESFKIDGKHRRIIFKAVDSTSRDRRYSLWACGLDGTNKTCIAGDKTDSVSYFTITDEWIFAVINGRKGVQVIYQISLDLKQATIIKKNVDIRRQIVADNEYLYYATFRDAKSVDPNKMMICQYNITSGTTKDFYLNIGIAAFQLYHDQLIVSTYTNCMVPSRNVENLQALNLQKMTMKPLSKEKISAKEFTCYLNQVVYIDKDSGFVYAVELATGVKHLLYKRSATHIDLVQGVISLIDVQKEEMILQEILGITSGDHVDGYTGYCIPVPQGNSVYYQTSEKKPVQDISRADSAGQVPSAPVSEDHSTSSPPQSDVESSNASEKAEPTQSKHEDVPNQGALTEDTFKRDMDQAWRNNSGRMTTYNVIKFFLTIIGIYTALGCWGLFDEGEILKALICALICFIDIYVCVWLQGKLAPDDVRDTEKKYETAGVKTTGYTPPGIRGGWFGLLCIACILIPIIIVSLL